MFLAQAVMLGGVVFHGRIRRAIGGRPRSAIQRRLRLSGAARGRRARYTRRVLHLREKPAIALCTSLSDAPLCLQTLYSESRDMVACSAARCPLQSEARVGSNAAHDLERERLVVGAVIQLARKGVRQRRSAFGRDRDLFAVAVELSHQAAESCDLRFQFACRAASVAAAA
jgi:hypothetical protein